MGAEECGPLTQSGHTASPSRALMVHNTGTKLFGQGLERASDTPGRCRGSSEEGVCLGVEGPEGILKEVQALDLKFII